MPYVPMPGAMPRGWSFRQNQNSERTLGQNSVASQKQSVMPQEVESVLESVAELPYESDDYDTPYRNDVKEVIGTNVGSTTNKLPKRSYELKTSRSCHNSKQRNKSFEPQPIYRSKHNDAYKRSFSKEEPKYDEPSVEESIPIADASFVPDVLPTARKTLSSQQYSYLSSDQPTIALFGGSGVTGGHFLTAALDAGYNVQCLPADDPREMGQQSQWDAIKLGLQDVEQLQAIVHCADYVVIMLNDVMPGKNEYPAGFLASFIERLYGVLREEATVKVVLLQATSLAIDVRGRIPVMSKLIKSVAHRRNSFLQDQDAAIDRIGIEHGLRKYNDENRSVSMAPPHFRFIVTRPSVLLQDGPSSKKLAASKSQPGPFPVAHIDLADFSLGALTTEKMFDSSPYVVADSF
uniref:NAD(P)-binding domain-containing protein n=1 Tax=Amphora coffeiformis TaxID=265554 RepID=A0A7S3L7I7_9STRA|mmetsp:Transcript_12541/g.24059  ORF Transcript_12541/g.24059 Transcript_12541/m.24059 type:complete len:406 (+) Transcript_12541:79-1296(+)